MGKANGVKEQLKIIVYNATGITFEKDKLFREKVCKLLPEVEPIWLDVLYEFREDKPAIVGRGFLPVKKVEDFKKLCKEHFGEEFNLENESMV